MSGSVRTGNYARREKLLFGGLLVLLLLFPLVSRAQLISIKTAPVATGDQFSIYPAETRAMGGVSIALQDRLADPFSNPAKATRLEDLHVFSTPSYYQITGNGGGARTMPLGALMKRGRWFGGLSVAVQELWGADDSTGEWAIPFTGTVRTPRTGDLLRERMNNNMYVTSLFGTDMPDSDVSLAGSAFYASLNALDGVEILYPNSQYVDQFGYMADIRLGVLEQADRGVYKEFVLVFNRLAMTHDVYRQRFAEADPWQVEEDVERNRDRTNTVGAKYTYSRPIGQNWRMGGTLTANRKMHPKIPNYELMNIPRDPGESWAFNAGLGLTGEADALTFGVDIIYEPIFSHTWANASQPIENDQGNIVVRSGQKTVDNRFEFGNTVLQTGLRREGKWTEFQAGVQIHTIRYWLDQQRFVTDTRRDQYESWTEWTAGFGAGVNLPALTIHYQLNLTTGTGRPGTVSRGWNGSTTFVEAARGDFLPAPEGPLTLNRAKVLTHQLSVSVPFGRP